MSRKKRKNKSRELLKAINGKGEKSSLIQSIKNIEKVDYNKKFKQKNIDLSPATRKILERGES